MSKDQQAAQNAQAESWRKQIEELTGTKSAPEKDEDTETKPAPTGHQQENSGGKPSPESARDFIRRKMLEEKKQGRK